MRPSSLLRTFLTLIICAALVHPAYAGPKRIYSPYVEEGELELEYYGTAAVDDDSDVDGENAHKVAVGYGVNNFWFTELVGEVEQSGESGADSEWTAIEWENRFQLTEPGQYWLDAGLYAAYEHSLETDHADKLEAKILLEKDFGKFSHMANISFEQEIGEYSEDHLEMELAWSSRYRYQPWLEPGFEIYSELGRADNMESFDEQEHLAGPVIYGDFAQHFHYELGYLFGISDASPDGEARWLIEYGVPF